MPFGRAALAATLCTLLVAGSLSAARAEDPQGPVEAPAAAALPSAAPAAAADAAPPATQPVVREIVITGTRMIEEATVRTRLRTREGDPYDPDRVSEDVKAVYELGTIENVTVDASSFEGGVRLTFALTERAVLRSVDFEGNKEVETKDLREKVGLLANASFSPLAVSEALGRLRALYREKGFYHALLRTRTEPAGEGQVRLVVVVEEGEKYKLAKIRFSGVKAIPEKDLRKEMKTAEWTIFSWMGSSGKLQEEVLQEDRQRLVSTYQERGFLEVHVGEPVVTVDDKERSLEVLVPVTEGAQYQLGALTLQGDDLVPLSEIRELLGLKEGEVFRRSAFAQAIYAVNQRYASRGYAFVKLDYTTRLNPEKRSIDVTMLIERGPVARFGRVTIRGNVTTRDKVIRRELNFAEGDIFNSEALRRSRQKVMNLGYFDLVDLAPHPQEDNVIDIDIEVKERLTGAISFGLGYSSEDKLTGQIRLSESNLLGRGLKLAFTVEYSPVRKNYTISFNNPAVFDSRWSFGFSLFDTKREYDEYDRADIGGQITLGRSLGEYVRGYVSVRHDTVTVDDLEDTASEYIKAQEGKATTNSVTLSLVRDTRDNFFNPTDGNRTSLSGEWAGGPFQGDNYFTKFEAEHSVYQPLFWKLVGMLHGQYGTVKGFDGREPPIYEKFFLGGITTLRGFPFRSVGPMDENDEPKGAYQEVVFNAELIVPIAPEQGFNLVLFYDTGNGWDKGQSVDLRDLRESAGFGIRWMSPLGPFRLEWGYVLDRREGEPKSDWSFIIGNFF